MRALMWFRADLRVRDNPALYHACRSADKGVVSVFALCPKQWRAHDWGDIRVNFLLRNLHALKHSLAERGVPLYLLRAKTFADVPSLLLQLARRLHCDELYYNREYEVNERRRDERVDKLFARNGRSVRTYDDQTLFRPGTVLKDDASAYSVFTPFRRRCYALYGKADGIEVLPIPKCQSQTRFPTEPVPTRLRGFGAFDLPTHWPAGEEYALRRLRAFIRNRVGQYHSRRDQPAINGTSVLSPYLATGVISVRQCLRAALAANSGRLQAGRKGITMWMSELLWREFYRHVLFAFPRVSMGRPFRLETDAVPWRHEEQLYRAWCEGRTGIPIVDAGMRQLQVSGWMHNRVRMIVAMFLTKDLLIDWRYGERHFMRHLVDGDLASNNGGWQWSASTGTDAAPYFRIFNPYKQSQRFDPEGTYIRRFVPELARVKGNAIHEPYGDSSASPARLDYPRPIVDHRETRERVWRAFAVTRPRR